MGLQRHIIIKTSKVEDKKRILKVARGKQLATHKELLHNYQLIFSRNFVAQRAVAVIYIFKVLKEKISNQEYSMPRKGVLQI